MRDDYGRTNFNKIKFSAALEKKTGLKMLTVGGERNKHLNLENRFKNLTVWVNLIDHPYRRNVIMKYYEVLKKGNYMEGYFALGFRRGFINGSTC